MSKSKSYRKSKSTSQLFGKGRDEEKDTLSVADIEKIKRQIQKAEKLCDQQAAKRLKSKLEDLI